MNTCAATRLSRLGGAAPNAAAHALVACVWQVRAAGRTAAAVNRVDIGVGIRVAQFTVRLLRRRREAQLDEVLRIGPGQLELIDMLERTATSGPLAEDDARLLPTVRAPTAPVAPNPIAELCLAA